MKLILKLPADKPPFLGVLYNNPSQAQRENQGLVKSGLGNFEIILIPIENKITLKLKSPDNQSTYWYEFLSYEKAALENWLRIAATYDCINFSHILQNHDKHIVVKTRDFGYLFVLKIDKVSKEP